MKKKNPDADVKMWMGMPMRWNHKKIFDNLWNKEDDRVFPPKQFGIGWSLNFHALLKRAGVVKKD